MGMWSEIRVLAYRPDKSIVHVETVTRSVRERDFTCVYNHNRYQVVFTPGEGMPKGSINISMAPIKRK
jgi:hypothetical protein